MKRTPISYRIWRKQRPENRAPGEWLETSHTLKAKTDFEAEQKLIKMFQGCGFSRMSLVALPFGKKPA